MQYDVHSPEEYLAVLAPDWRRERLEEIRALIKSIGPDLTEEIQYKMLAYRDEKGVLFHLNAQKNYVSLYVGDTKKIDEDGSLLAGLDLGKGCIRFKKSVQLADTQLKTFLERTIALWKLGKDLGC